MTVLPSLPKRTLPTIGVFDSGVGGLTVLRALRRRLPGALYLYMADTARLPYGSKSQSIVARYAVESARFLVAQRAEYLVIACNTASALALPELRAAVPVPVLGVIETGADAALAASRSGDVGVLATTATVSSHAYLAACRERNLRALEKACPLLVPLVEEGWTEHPVTREVLGIYLRDSLPPAQPRPACAPMRWSWAVPTTRFSVLRSRPWPRPAPPSSTQPKSPLRRWPARSAKRSLPASHPLQISRPFASSRPTASSAFKRSAAVSSANLSNTCSWSTWADECALLRPSPQPAHRSLCSPCYAFLCLLAWRSCGARGNKARSAS